MGDIKERAHARASGDREQEELKKAPKTINVVINKQSGSWSIERLEGFQFVLQGANGRYTSTHIETNGTNRGTCRFTQPVPPGNYTLDISVLGMRDTVQVPELSQSSLAMTMNIASRISISFR